MATTLLRVGLYILIVVLAAYVIHESFEEQPIAEMIPMPLLQKALVIGILTVAVGIILRLFEKTAKVVVKNRCRVCRVAIPSGAIYCRAHLRSVLHHEDDKTHMTRVKKIGN